MAETVTNVDQFQPGASDGTTGGTQSGGSSTLLTPPPPTDTNPSIPIDPTTPTRPTINLLTGITINKLNIHSIYTKGSGTAIPSDSFVITNTFPDLVILVSMDGLAGVTFNPNSFDLHPNESKEVAVAFDRAQIENLPEGVSTLTVGVTLSSTLPTYQPPPVVTPPDPVPPTPVIFWINGIDGSYNVGSPPPGWHQGENGMWLPPDFPVLTPPPVDPTPPPIVVTPTPPIDVTPSIPINPPLIPPITTTPDPIQPTPIFTPSPPQDTTPSIPIGVPLLPVAAPIPVPTPAPISQPIPIPEPTPTPAPLPPPPEPPFEPPVLFDDPTVPFPRFNRPADE